MKRLFKNLALLGVTLMALSACCNGGGNTADAVLENIHSRKSVRQYTAEPVSQEDIETLLRAAMAAPTAVNFQPWRFVVLNEREQLDALAEHLPYAKMITQAPLAIVVCGETLWMGGNENPFWAQDCSAATQNLLLAAEAIGLGAVWTAAYPDTDRCKAISDALGLPSTVQPLCVIPIGHPAGEDQPKDKWKPENIHYGRW